MLPGASCGTSGSAHSGLLSPREFCMLCSVLLTILSYNAGLSERPDARVNFPAGYSCGKKPTDVHVKDAEIT